MVKINPPSEEKDVSHDFVKNIKSEKAEDRLEKELSVSKNLSISEVQKCLGGFFPQQDVENLRGKTVDSLMSEASQRIEKSINNVSISMKKHSAKGLTKRLWELGADDVTKQIKNTALSGKLNSIELGGAYLAHLDLAKTKAISDWKTQNQINNELLTKEIQIKPLFGPMNFFKKHWQKASAQKSIEVGGGTLSGAVVGNAAAHGVGALAGLIGGAQFGSKTGSALGIPGTIIGGLLGGLAGVVAPKYFNNLRLEWAARQREAQAMNYQMFEPTFMQELEKKFNGYEATAKAIETGGALAAQELGKSIKAQVDSADDTQKGELVSKLLAVKNNPNAMNLSSVIRTFSNGVRLDKQHEITFIEAVKRIDWLDDLVSVQRSLNSKAAQNETFTESARAQEVVFTKQLNDANALNEIFTRFDEVKNFEVEGQQPFKAVTELEGSDQKNLTSADIFKDIKRDLMRENKADGLMKLMPDGLARGVGYASSARLIIALNWLFTKNPKVLVDNTISALTRQKIISWIRHKDIESRAGIPEENEITSKFLNSLLNNDDSDKGGILKKGKDLLTEIKKFDFSSPGGRRKEDYDQLLDNMQKFNHKIIRARVQFDRASKNLAPENKFIFEETLKNLEKQKNELRNLVNNVCAKKKAYDDWKTRKNSFEVFVSRNAFNAFKSNFDLSEKEKKSRQTSLTTAKANLGSSEKNIKALKEELKNSNKTLHALQQNNKDIKYIETEIGKKETEISTAETGIPRLERTKREKQEAFDDAEKEYLRMKNLKTDYDKIGTEPSIDKKDLKNYQSLTEKIDEFFIKTEERDLSSLVKTGANLTHNYLYKRIKDVLYKEFEEEMNPRILDNLAKVDVFAPLSKLKENQFGKVDLEYIDALEARDELSMPSDLDSRHKETMYISKNSNEKGVELVNKAGTLLIRIVKEAASAKNLKLVSNNAHVFDRDPRTGKETNARTALVTNLRISQ